jgi:hypothetical protein
MAEAVPVQHLSDGRQRHALVETTPDQGLDPRQCPGLVRSAVRHRPLANSCLSTPNSSSHSLGLDTCPFNSGPTFRCAPKPGATAMQAAR